MPGMLAPGSNSDRSGKRSTLTCQDVDFLPDFLYNYHVANLESIHARCVRTEEGCLLWLGAISPDTGYSRIGHEGGTLLGHRLVFALACRELEPGEHVDHTCHSESPQCSGTKVCLHRRCLEPAHLEAVSQAENNRRARARVVKVATRRTNAESGLCRNELHPWVPENIGTRQTKRGVQEFCRPCHREVQRAYERRVAAKEGRTVGIRMASRKLPGQKLDQGNESAPEVIMLPGAQMSLFDPAA